MKLLTVQQPWADAIICPPGGAATAKSIENRVWYTSLRERIGIHAGLRVDHNAGIPLDENARRGAVLGTVEITGCHEAGSVLCQLNRCEDNPWAHWPDAKNPLIFHWEIEHPREFVTPIPAKGMQKLWEPGPSVAHLMSIADLVITLPPTEPIVAFVRYAMCGGCEYLDEHPRAPHSWAGPEDLAHAAATQQPDPSNESCACPCAKEDQ